MVHINDYRNRGQPFDWAVDFFLQLSDREQIQQAIAALESGLASDSVQSASAILRDAIQPPRLAWDGLEGAARPSMSIRNGSKGMTIGRGAAPERSHANLGTAGSGENERGPERPGGGT